MSLIEKMTRMFLGGLLTLFTVFIGLMVAAMAGVSIFLSVNGLILLIFNQSIGDSLDVLISMISLTSAAVTIGYLNNWGDES